VTYKPQKATEKRRDSKRNTYVGLCSTNEITWLQQIN